MAKLTITLAVILSLGLYGLLIAELDDSLVSEREREIREVHGLVKSLGNAASINAQGTSERFDVLLAAADDTLADVLVGFGFGLGCAEGLKLPESGLADDQPVVVRCNDRWVAAGHFASERRVLLVVERAELESSSLRGDWTVITAAFLILMLLWAGVGKLFSRRAQASLKDTNAQLNAVVDTAVDAIITIDSRGAILSYNRAAELIFGYQGDDIIGKNIATLMRRKEGDAHQGHIDAYLKTGEAKIIGIGRELVARHADGHDIPIELSISEVSVGGRRLFTGIIRDISRRKADEALRARSNQILRELYESQNASSERTERIQNVLNLVKAFLRVDLGVLGRKHGSGMAVLYATDGRFPEEEALQFETSGVAETLDDGEPISGTATEASNACLRWGQERLELSRWLTTGVVFDRESLVLLFGSGTQDEEPESFSPTDIEILRLAAQTIRSEILLGDEQDKVLRADRLASVGTLAAAVAHEVNNPLAGVIAGIDALQKRRVSEDRKDAYYSTMREGLERIRVTVRGLLDFSRQRSVSSSRFDIGAVVSDSLTLARPCIEKKHIVIDNRVAHDTHFAVGDRFQIAQALLNILLNAADVTPNEQTIVIDIRQGTLGMGIEVIDSGPGLSPEAFNQALTPFFTSKPEGEGTGLGLPITQSILQAHKGDLECRRAEGGGASFTLWIGFMAA